jgi:hypothetical protein
MPALTGQPSQAWKIKAQNLGTNGQDKLFSLAR